MIKFACSNCGHRMGASEKYAGKKVKCKKCGQITRIPEAQQAPEAHTEQKNIIKFRCPSCNQKIGVKAKYAGKKVRCAKCKKPMIIPTPAEPQIQADDKEAAPMTKARPEKVFQEEKAGDLSSEFDDLLALEASAPTVETEPPLKLAPAEEQTVSDYPLDETKFMGTQVIEPPKKSKARFFVIAGTLIVTVIISIISLFVMPQFEKKKQAEQIQLLQAQTLAEDYIEILENRRIDEALQLLSPELQDSTPNSKMNGFATRVSKGPILQITPSISHVEKNKNKKLFYFQFTLFYTELETQDFEINWRNFEIDPVTNELNSLSSGFNWLSPDVDWQSLIMVISKENIDLRIENLALYNSATGNTASIGQRNYKHLFMVFVSAAEQKLRSLATFLTNYACILIPVVPIAYIIMVISLWLIFDKSGESRWAAFIPVYNLCVLGKVANRPIWYGLLLILASFIPFVGRYVWVFFWADISFGVACEFDKGIFFTIGMIFLPFIFYPILAFFD